MLEAADVGRLRRELDGRPAVDDLHDGILGLLHRVRDALAAVAAPAGAQRLEKLLHLDLGVLPQHVDGQALLLGVLEGLASLAVVDLGGQHHVGVLHGRRHLGADAQRPGRLHQPVAVDAIGEDPGALADDVLRQLPHGPRVAHRTRGADARGAGRGRERRRPRRRRLRAAHPAAAPTKTTEPLRLARRGQVQGLANAVLDDAGRGQPALLRRHGEAAQQRVDGAGDLLVYGHAVPRLDLHQGVEGRRGLALQHALARAAPPRLLVAEGDRLHAAEQVGQRGVHQQIVQAVAVRRRHELHPAFGDRARGGGLRLRPHLVDDDDLRHMVLHGLDHHGVLLGGRRHLHAARPADAGVRHVAVAGDLV